LQSAQARYRSLFVDTGLVQGSYDLLLPDDASIRARPELGKLADSPLWPWVGDRLAVVWQSLYMAVQRAVLLLAWWPFIAFALLGIALTVMLAQTQKRL
jgi:hypothetical protein